MFKFVCVVLFLSALYISGEAHAVLKIPQPWTTNPSKASPCGGAATLAAPSAAWKIGSTVNVTWQVIAGDGAGTVNIIFDANAAQNFVQSSAIQIGNAPNVGTFLFSFTVPQVTCNGANGVCSIQVASSSSWFSCSTVQLTQNNPPPVIPPAPACTLVKGLTFCSELNGQYVMVPPGQTPADVDTQTQQTFTANFANPKVFSSNSTDCATAYKTFLCHNDLPYCPSTAACQTLCGNALTLCEITTAHAGLYNCATGPQSCCQNNTNTCTAPVTAVLNPTATNVNPTIPNPTITPNSISFTPVTPPTTAGAEIKTFFKGLIALVVILVVAL